MRRLLSSWDNTLIQVIQRWHLALIVALFIQVTSVTNGREYYNAEVIARDNISSSSQIDACVDKIVVLENMLP